MTKFTDLERLAMRQALLLAEKGSYTTGENPRVGACLIKDGNLIAQGFHRAPGRPHAERVLLPSETDDDVIVDDNLHHLAGFNDLPGEIDVGLARMRIAGRMVVAHDDG